MHECKYDKVIEYIRDDIKEIKLDVKTILSMKYKIIGGFFILGFIINLVFVIIGNIK